MNTPIDAFTPFPKMARLTRPAIITETIDGTNAQIAILELDGHPQAIDSWDEDNTSYVMLAGSRKRWITPEADNFGFAEWAKENALELRELGKGKHFGEWWGKGIQRGYGLNERRFSLFNALRWCAYDREPSPIEDSIDQRVDKWQEKAPACCHIVPVLYRGDFDTEKVDIYLGALRELGSYAAPGFMKPEGVVVFHEAGNVGFKKTLENDHQPKGK